MPGQAPLPRVAEQHKLNSKVLKANKKSLKLVGQGGKGGGNRSGEEFGGVEVDQNILYEVLNKSTF